MGAAADEWLMLFLALCQSLRSSCLGNTSSLTRAALRSERKADELVALNTDFAHHTQPTAARGLGRRQPLLFVLVNNPFLLKIQSGYLMLLLLSCITNIQIYLA